MNSLRLVQLGLGTSGGLAAGQWRIQGVHRGTTIGTRWLVGGTGQNMERGIHSLIVRQAEYLSDYCKNFEGQTPPLVQWTKRDQPNCEGVFWHILHTLTIATAPSCLAELNIIPARSPVDPGLTNTRK